MHKLLPAFQYRGVSSRCSPGASTPWRVNSTESPCRNGLRRARVDAAVQGARIAAERTLALVLRERRAERRVVALFLPTQLRAPLDDGELLLPQLRAQLDTVGTALRRGGADAQRALSPLAVRDHRERARTAALLERAALAVQVASRREEAVLALRHGLRACRALRYGDV